MSRIQVGQPTSNNGWTTPNGSTIPSEIAAQLQKPEIESINAGVTETNAAQQDSTSTELTTAPNAPTSLIVTGFTNESVSLSWDDVNGGTTWHRVYFRIGSTGGYEMGAELPPGTLEATVAGLQSSTTYEFVVTAYDATNDLESGFSNTATETTSA